MTYDEVCIEIIALGGTEIPSSIAGTRAFAMPAPCLVLVPLTDADGGGAVVAGFGQC